MPSKVIIIKAK